MKFVDQLTQSNENIRAERAQNAGQRTKIEQEALVRDLEKERLEIKSKIDDLGDLAPKSSTSLTIQDHDPKQWVKEMQELKVQLLNNKVALEAARETMTEWFGGEDE